MVEKVTFGSVIAFAIDKEIEAADFYQQVSECAKNANVKEMFKEFAEIEMTHKKMLENITPEDISTSSVESVPNLKISDYLSEVTFKPDMGYQEVLIIAMKREEKSYQLYTDLAQEYAGSELEKLFLTLAQEEAKHKLHLEKEYDENVLTDF